MYAKDPVFTEGSWMQRLHQVKGLQARQHHPHRKRHKLRTSCARRHALHACNGMPAKQVQIGTLFAKTCSAIIAHV